jgi:hypothetical protein
MREPDYDKKIRHVADLQKNAVQKYSVAKFISAFDLLSGEKPYQAFMPDDKGVMRATRNPDGTHLSTFGGTILTEKIIAALKKDIDLSIIVSPEIENPVP